MGTEGVESLDVLVAGRERPFAEAVAERMEAARPSVAAEPVDPGADLLRRDVSADGVVLDAERDDSTAVIERLAPEPSPAVVLLAGTGAEESVATAHEVGAAGVFPRTAVESQCTAIGDRIERSLDGEAGAPRTGRDEPEPAERRAYRAVFENVSDGLVVHDADTGEIRDVNERFCEMNGYAREELVGEDIGLVTPASEEYGSEAAAERIEAAREAGPQLFEWRNQHKDGTTFPVEVHLSVVELRGTERVLASVRDISERQELEQTYRDVFRNVSDGLVVHDPETGEIRDVNERYCELTGFDREELVGATIERIIPPDPAYSLAGAIENIDRAREEGAQLFEFKGLRKDGTTFMSEVHLTTVELRGTEQVLASVRDVSERKRRERMIRALHESTEALHDAGTPEAVCEATVTAAEEVLGLSMPACWLRAGDGSGTLAPVAAGEGAWDLPLGGDAPGEFEPGDFEYEVFESGECRVYDPSELYEETPLESAVLVPLGDHGLLGAAEPDVEALDEVALDAARTLARHATTALDRVQREAELRESEQRFRTIAERVEEVIYLANADMTDVEYVNSAYADVYGRPVEELREDPRAFLEAVHPEDREEYEAAVEAMLADIEAGDPDDSYEFEFRIQRPDGGLRWLEATGYPILDESDEPDQFVGLATDVTERHRREETLETFHEATRELTGADSREAACRQAVGAAESVLGFPLVSAYLYDDETGRLEPSAVTPRLEELGVEPRPFSPGESLPWQVFVEGEAVTTWETATDVYGPGVSDPDIVLPLGSHGVMLVGAPSAAFDAEAVELAQILAATLEAALNHVAGERALAEREAELRRQQERADRLQRLNAVIRDIEQATVEQSSRSGIEEAVCERLVDVDAHDAVWIAEPTVGDDELVARTGSDGTGEYVDGLAGAVGPGTDAGTHPAVVAYREEAPRVVGNVATSGAGEWRKHALRHGIQSVIAVPIRYETTTHGVLSVASATPDAFDEATRDVLAELGRSIGYAITVTERERALESEGTTELEFAVDDEGLFVVRGARAAGCRVDLERTIRRTGGSFSMFYAVEGAPPADVVEVASAAPSVESAQVVSTDDEGESGLIEVTAPTWFGSVFTDHGAVVRAASVDADGGSLVVEAPRGTDVRALVEGFQERYPDTELVAQRQRERTIRSSFELQDALREGLTDRQWEALETAYSAGYFAWPRETSGQEVAELLGVSQPTFNKHLRIAERSAFRMLLDREYPGEE